MLFESVDSGTTLASESAAYHEVIGAPGFPVLADVNSSSLALTPYDGAALPGKCVLTPEMEILECIVSHDSTELLALIEQHAASR